MLFKLIIRLKYLLFDIETPWEIGVINTPIEEIILSKSLSKNIKWFKPPRKTSWADPFGVKYENKYYIFYEEKKVDKYGLIKCMILNEDLKIEENKTIIDEGIHFSFPNIFNFEDNFYVIPETFSKNKISLYKCEKFPFKWSHEVDILNESCVDSSLLFFEDNWYLFYCKIGHGNKLFLRVNKNLKYSWDNCLEKLVNDNAFNSQNGGKMIEINKIIFRVSQNCKNKYGESIVINQIEKISPSEYIEKVYHEFKLSNNKTTGFHTMNSCGELTIIDRRMEYLYLKKISRILNPIIEKMGYYLRILKLK